MPTITLVSRNTIKLSASASAVDDFYVGYKIILKRVEANGKVVTQEKEIVAYSGTSKVATIGGIWEYDYVPDVGDTYEIVPNYRDERVSINPAIQTLDYVSSTTYGRGLDVNEDLKFDSWLNSARICDTRSDIYVRFTGSAPTVGDEYTTFANRWQGKVAEIIGDYIRFTDCIGKLSYAWSDWRTFQSNVYVYHKEKLYKTNTSGTIPDEPVHASGTVGILDFVSALSLTKLSGAGPASIPLYVDGNPVRFKKGNIPLSGYTLYDSDGVDYFRMIGWDTNDQRSVTRHQTNLTIDTAAPLFENTNSLLEHFGGIMRYSGGKYVLEIEEKDDGIDNDVDEPRNITDDDIIGRISINDNGLRNSYNSLTVAYSDPANKFESRNISFFNSEFLKADKNVPKKGNLSIPGVTNYYNARILADKFLTKSRYGLTINLNLVPKGALLLPGKVIQLQYPRYNWVNKRFRIDNLTHNNDCSVDIVATEYDDSFYTISNISKNAAAGLSSNSTGTTIDPPSNLTTTNINDGNEITAAIQLSWEHNPLVLRSTLVSTEIYASYSPHLYLTVSGISSNIITTVENPHQLEVGQIVYPMDSVAGLEKNVPYYVKTVTGNTLTLSSSRDGPTLTLADSAVAFRLQTATIIASVNPPTSSYVDTEIYSPNNGRVDKYYWLRYKVNQQ